MRRAQLVAVMLATALAISACGSSSGTSGASASSPQATALSYFPAGTPFVLSLDTAPAGAAASQLKSVEGSSTQATLVKAALFNELAKANIDYNTEVKPLFGNPLVFGLDTTEVSGGSEPVLLAWQTSSATALAKLIASTHAKAVGHHDGATLYDVGTAAIAVHGALVLIASHPSDLTAALDLHAGGGGFSAADYAADTQGLPSGAALTIAGDLTSVLDTAKAAKARMVPWVAAIKSYGVTLNASKSNVSLNFRLDTSGKSLSASQLPLAQGSQATSLTGDAPINAGLRDPAQLYDFALAADKVADPAGYAKLMRQEATAQQRTGVDVPSFIDSLTGALDIASDGHVTIVREPASAATAASFEKLLTHPGSGTQSTAVGGGFYDLTESDGTQLTAGTADGYLLIGRATPAQLKTYATATSSPSTSPGALSFKVSLPQLLALRSTSPEASAIAKYLGDLVGSIQATPSALTGSASLQIKLSGSGA